MELELLLLLLLLHGAGICGWIAGESLDHVVSFFRCTPILGHCMAIAQHYTNVRAARRPGHLPVLDPSSDSRSPMDAGDAVAVACSTNCRARDI